jgi:hypothetical protein
MNDVGNVPGESARTLHFLKYFSIMAAWIRYFEQFYCLTSSLNFFSLPRNVSNGNATQKAAFYFIRIRAV